MTFIIKENTFFPKIKEEPKPNSTQREEFQLSTRSSKKNWRHQDPATINCLPNSDNTMETFIDSSEIANEVETDGILSQTGQDTNDDLY